MREDYQGLIDEVSALLGAPATLEDRDFTLIAFGAHSTESDDDLVLDPVRTRSIMQRRSSAAVRAWFERFGITRARGPVRIPPDPAAGVVKGRICLPVRHGGVAHGYIWLLDDGTLELDDPRLTEALATADRIGALLAAEAHSGARLGELLHTALTGPAGERLTAAEELRSALGPAAGRPLAVVAVTPWRAEGAGPPATRLPQVPVTCPVRPGDAAAPAEGALAALVRLHTPEGLDPARSAGERLLRSPRSGAPDGTGSATSAGAGPGPVVVPGAGPVATAGVSAGLPGLAEPAEAWRQALAAARAARAEPRLGPVALWPELGPYRLLTALPDTVRADPVLRRLLDPAHREMARTAEVYLDCAGQAGRAAAALGVHRQTLYYRLSRVEQLTGLDLGDGESRLLLHMALKATRL
ncbi:MULTISPECIES: PucR family transcriptional regulator [unclassified Streptomyces]|uniref:PucR family transcriptional regulator n=1 Tax=unclassified Streptomyces TaxID=2593676 RepID=UPI0022B5E59E|nr:MULTISPECIES: helix-turn-helix domain-containing protein [unclassified Streptomyces]MCZ7416357.1 helix-turn-helix domain-containing protein [Streptomyces sp. WMMC897]MCZ7433833.1 helix-turn-helix domain-containing protein [Streptomyces sp. WMMC1477]